MIKKAERAKKFEKQTKDRPKIRLNFLKDKLEKKVEEIKVFVTKEMNLELHPWIKKDNQQLAVKSYRSVNNKETANLTQLERSYKMSKNKRND